MYRLKKYLYLVPLILSTLILGGCGEDEPISSKKPSLDTENTDNTDNKDNETPIYYVKYEAHVTSVFSSVKNVDYKVNTDKGSQTFTSGTSFSKIFGPFEKGFNASITADSRNYSTECFVEIYVCRGNEPFALKANNSGKNKVTTSYTIDF